MVKIAKIKANDDEKGKAIYLGYRRCESDGQKGWQVCASNGDDVAYFAPLSKEKCIEDIYAAWGAWETFELI